MFTYFKQLDTLSHDLNSWINQFPEGIHNVQSLAQEYKTKLERFRTEEQRLSIGVMGQVKAGKSTFLNALLFNGLPVLPEAATPKTANLTLITYGEEARLELEYYTESDWKALEQEAETGGTHPEAKMSKELMEMAKASGLDPYEKIKSGREIISLGKTEDLVGMLNDYAGENGRYTPIIKMISIFLPIEELRNLEVVDTPGMNDPVISRTEKTKEYMARCDVVFFLSRCGQFLDSSDMNLLARQLPGKGVKRMVLVAGQFDAVILDDGYDRTSLAETEKNILTRLGRRSAEEMEKLAKSYEERDRQEIANLVRSIKTPIFSSTFAHGFASWPEDKWNRSMKHVHGELSEMAADKWDGYEFTNEDWMRIGNFSSLKQQYDAAVTDKKAILHEQQSRLEPETKAELKDRLSELSDMVNQRLDFMQKNDISSIKEQKKEFEHRISGIASTLSALIGAVITEVKKARLEILAHIQAEMSGYMQMNTRTGTETYTSYTTVSTSKWYNPFSWGSSERVAVTRTRSYQYVLASDAVEKVIMYGNESSTAIQLNFSKVFSPLQLKANLRKALIQEMDTSNTGFDPNWFRSIIEQAIRQLDIPTLRMDLGDIAEVIVQQFQGEIRTDQMEHLTLALSKALHCVLKRIGDVFEPAVDLVCRDLENVQSGLQSQLTENLNSELENIQKAFEDKNAEMESYRALLDRIDQEHMTMN